MIEYSHNYRNALEDFFEARRRATVRNILARIQGKNYDLLSFDDVRKKLKAEISDHHQTLTEIPLDAIVGSVNRYQDFTRDFLPKNSVQASRWARVEVNVTSQDGLPPIEVYKLGRAYFVLDGNHRVSVARASGTKTIQAYVNEIKTRVDLDPHDTPEDIIIKAELTNFLHFTRLDILRPGSDFSATSPEAYTRLEEHIRLHQYYLNVDEQKNVGLDEAILHWYDNYYLWIIEIIDTNGLVRDFPGKTKTDLYLWLNDYRTSLQATLAEPVSVVEAARHFASQQIATQSTATPDPGELRRYKESTRQEGCLFSDILVPVNGTDSSWFALRQAIEIAHKETSRIHGLHVVIDDSLKDGPEALKTQSSFNEQCEAAGVEGKLVITSGNVGTQILERSGMTDLIVVNLAYPPGASALGRLTNGFRTLVQRSTRPVLACPDASSKLDHALLAFDNSPTSQEALYMAAYIAGKWNMRLTVLTISQPDKSDSASEQALEYLSSHHVDAEHIAEKGQVAPLILKYANQSSVDLVIMGGYGSTTLFNFLFDTVADQVLRESSKPMLLCR